VKQLKCKRMKKAAIIILMFILTVTLQAQNVDPKMQWFSDAKLGIFIHYGIYSVKGIGESWSFYNHEITYEEYMKQAEGFTASKYDPAAWAALFKEAGARYAVLTTKHHDGFALWDTKFSDLNAVKKSPAKRDLVGPYCEALRAQGLKVGLYFSHLDWSNPDYASVETDKKGPVNEFSYAAPGKGNKEAWERFIKFQRGQLNELQTLYKPDLLWFDGDWERSAEQWGMKELRDILLKNQPDVILNSRMQGYGDYATPEQGVPVTAPKGPWELCMTTNDSWGFQGRDNNYKSLNYIIQIFSECIGMGGNLLLDIGPKPDGTIDGPQTAILKGLGRWTKKHQEAIWGTTAGLPLGHFYGPTTISKDKKTIYLFYFGTPNGELVLKGIRNNIKNIRIVGSNTSLTWKRNGGAAWNRVPGNILMVLPQQELDNNCTVIAVEMEEELDLFHGAGGNAIEAN